MPFCGPIALYLLARMEGRAADLAHVQSRVVIGTDGSSTLDHLRQAADSLGLQSEAVLLKRTDWPLDRPAILHLDRGSSGHFVVIRPVGHTGKLVQVIDAPDQVEVMDFDQLASDPSWTGAALVPTHKAIAPWRRILLALTLAAGPVALWYVLKHRRTRPI
jgi:ABC-type bacteriocin/lantibiotic exporter with double-glycine peptidase domain